MALDDISEAEAEQILKDLDAGKITPGRIERQKGNVVIMPLEPPEPEEVRQPVSMFDTTPGVEATFFSRPPKEGLKKVLGATLGITELFNPFPLFRQAEIGVRAFGEEAEQTGLSGILERLEKAAPKAVTPRLDVPQLAAGIRTVAETGIDVLTGEAGLSEIPENLRETFSEEFAKQELFEKNLVDQDAKNTAELVGGGVSLVLLAKQLRPQIIKKLLALRGLKNISFDSILVTAKKAVKGLKRILTGTPKADKKAKEAALLAQKLIGDTSSDVGKAITNRVEKVEALVKGSPDTRSLLPEVNRIRTNIDETQRLLGEVVGNFKTILLGKTKVRFDPTRIKQLTKSARFKGKVGGQQFLSSGQLKFLDQVDNALKNDPTAATVVKLVAQFDKRLAKFYRLRDRGEKLDPSDLELFRIREALDDGLTDLFPAYDQAKTAYSQFKRSANNIRGPIDSPNAESFMANLFNQNKTEIRARVLDIIDQGKEASNNIVKLSNRVKTDFPEVNRRLRASIAAARRQARNFKSENGEKIFNDVIDKIAARKVKAAGDSGFADVPADKVRIAVDRRILDAENRGELIGKVTLSGVLALATKDIGMAELLAGMLGGSIGKTAGRIMATPKAVQQNSVEQLFKLMKESKNVSKGVREWVTDMSFILTEGGIDAVVTILRTITPNLEVRGALQNAVVALGSLKAVTPEVLSRDIEFTEGSTVTPGAQ